MNRLSQFGLAVVIALSVGILSSGCEYMSDDAASASTDVTGSWLYSDSKGMQSTWTLVQSTDDTISGSGTVGEKIIGSISGDTVSMTMTNSGSLSLLTGAVSGDTIAGHYTNKVYGAGSWTAVKID